MSDPSEPRPPSPDDIPSEKASARAPHDGDEHDGDDEGDAQDSGQQQGAGRKRRRRRRRRGGQVFFTPEGQAYRMVAGPDGRQSQVFLTPEELAAHQARQPNTPAQQGEEPGGGPQAREPREGRNRRHKGGQGQAQQGNLQPVEGVLDVDVKGPNAYLRQLKKSYLAAPDDPEIPKNLVQKLRLRPGQHIQALAQPRGQRSQVQRVEAADGIPLDRVGRLAHFGDLTSIDPEERIRLENGHKEMVTRVLDLVAPVGKGTRGLIVAPPKTGKTIMLQRIAQSVVANHPEIHVMVVLIDERPEEVTDMRRSIKGAEVLASSSDRNTIDHLKVAEMAIERAKRMVESGRDVLILLDSITRLARAYNKEGDSSGRTLTGGVDSRALERPKRLFGAARATEEAGTLTIIGTALIDTGSRMDEVIFEEFKGTGNSEVTLDRYLAEKRIFPAINIPQSGTRKEEKLFTQKEYEKVRKLRGMLFNVKPIEAMEALVKRLSRSTYNDEFLDEL
ncbi:MAG TPA: transcription termination factor Rho [Myxococcaceae bacterium]|nr:transcription termination factor Rho [Myxococcaceae bacterium]